MRARAVEAAGLFGRRFVVSRPLRVRAATLSATIALLLLGALNLTWYAAASSARTPALAITPELDAYLRTHDRVLLILIVVDSVVVLAGVFVVSILESHRIAGAAYRVGRSLRQVSLGRYDTRLVLRRADGLRELEDAFNDMTAALRERTAGDIERLERLATVAAHRPADLAAELDTAIAEKRAQCGTGPVPPVLS
jgi:hypothetical protein